MKLFFMPGSCSFAPHIVLQETGQKYEVEKVVHTDKTHLLKFNSRGLVPTLVLDDGKALTETAAILQYLADSNPAANLVPVAGTWERVRCQEWLSFVGTELHKGIGILFNKEFDENAKAIFKASIGKKLKWFDEQLSKGDYVMGSQICIADIYAFVVISWTHYVGIELTPYGNLTAYMEKIKNRPATIAAIEVEKKAK